MRQRDYIAALNQERMRMIHHLIDHLVPVEPLPPKAVAELKRAAIACSQHLSGSACGLKQLIEKVSAELMHPTVHPLDVPQEQVTAGRRAVRRLRYHQGHSIGDR